MKLVTWLHLLLRQQGQCAWPMQFRAMCILLRQLRRKPNMVKQSKGRGWL